jgi:hypothetical protein
METTFKAATETAEAVHRYRNDPRFRATTQSVVHEALQDFMRRNPGADHRAAHDLATEVAALMQARLFAADAELLAQREIAERYKRLAEDALSTSNRPPLLFRGAVRVG